MSERLPTDDELLALADAVSARAYAPYSNFLVGCAVLARDGRVIEGVNVENAVAPARRVRRADGVLARRRGGLPPRGLRRRGDHGISVWRVPPVAA